MVEEDMCAVVRRLHAEDSAAVLELLEFDYALDQLSRVLEELTGASQELHAAVRRIAGTGAEGLQQVDVAQDQAGRLHACAMQFLAAFRMLNGGVKGWNIAEARRPSTKPSRDGGSSPVAGT